MLPAFVRHVIVDRDGVLNREIGGSWLVEPREWEWETGSREAIRLLAIRGVAITIATNQSCIGRGLVARETVDQLHAWLGDEIAKSGAAILDILVCPHAPEEGCLCRKPKPGLILEAMRGSGVAPEETCVIGDDLRDIEAARAAGVSAALVRTGKGMDAAVLLGGSVPIFNDLLDAAEAIVARQGVLLPD